MTEPNPLSHSSTDLSNALLSKAEALIRRSRTSRIEMEEDEDAPILNDTLDDLPELTDTFLSLQEALARLDKPEDEELAQTLTKESTENTGMLPPIEVGISQEAFDKAMAAVKTEAAKSIAEAETKAKAKAALAIAEAEAHAREQINSAISEADNRAKARANVAIAEAENRAKSDAERIIAEAEIRAKEASTKTINEAVDRARMGVVEHLIDLDAYIAQALETWINTELPGLISSELDGMVERLRVKTTAHMSATLLPELSAKLSEVLEKSSNPTS